VVFGEGARDDEAVIDVLGRLRRDANWAYLKPKRKRLRADFLHRVEGHLARAEEGSLADSIASMTTSSATAPADQVAHWLFAFDAAAMASFRALALLDAHPAHKKAVQEEVSTGDAAAPRELPLLRATVLESIRLWPTTPAILRDATSQSSAEGGSLPTGTAILIFAPLFHRDEDRVPHADNFAPERWTAGNADQTWALLPFSAGPAVCPGRNLVLLVTSSILAALLQNHSFTQTHTRGLDRAHDMPGTLSPFRLQFSVLPRERGP
jgi:cytochrome P450